MALISIVPRPAASASAAPEIPAKIMLASTLTWARPPLMLPTTQLAKSKIFWVMPRAFIILPARMKNGTASRETVFVLFAICCGTESRS